MPGGPGRSTYSFRSSSPRWVRSFLEQLGGALARAPPGHALLVELPDGGRFPEVTARRPDFDPTIDTVARSLPGGLRVVPRTLGTARLWNPEEQIGFLTERRDGPAEGPLLRRPERGSNGGLRIFPGPIGLHVQAHWFPDPTGKLRAWTRFVPADPREADRTLFPGGLELARRIEAAGGPRPEVHLERRWLARGEWTSGRLGWLRKGRPLLLAPGAAAAPMSPVVAAGTEEEDWARHTVVLGATGSGKTGLLAAIAADRIARGTPVLVFDVHGDLAPAIVARLGPRDAARVLAIDATAPPDRIPGLAILDPGTGEGAEAAAADVVAALKRLSTEGGETYWGFRLERIFDTFVRLVQDEQGTLLDLAALLTDERRRESARLTAQRPEAARFLDELPAILRRSPEFLWPAASRLSKIALMPALAALLAPPDGGLPIEEWVGRNGSIAWRIPFSHLGPEGASLAGTLLATRAYLGLVRHPVRPGKRLRALFVFDEAHAFSARLLTEMLAEGRKFGLGVVLASQYPERLDPELRAAAAGAAGTHVVFRVPPASARAVGSWIGLTPADAEALLPSLPVGQALRARASAPAAFLQGEPLVRPGGAAWSRRVERTSDDHTSGESGETRRESDGIADAILLELVGREGASAPREEIDLVVALGEREFDPIDAEAVRRELSRLLARGWVERVAGHPAATPAGARRLGIGAPTGATSESAEHRALLIEAFRIFARRGLRMEILRQGRFDTRLPDAVVPIAPRLAPNVAPERVWKSLEARRGSWAWRFFHGRHVHVEAEVSGAERRERIRRGLTKAERRGAFALFLVADTRRARRVRSVLVDAGAYPDRAQVWTLPKARAALPGTRALRP